MDNAFNGQILLSGFVIGIIVFQTALAAPIVFIFLEKSQSRIFIRKIFPRIFWLLFSLGILMLLLILSYGYKSHIQLLVSYITIMLPLICALMVEPTNKATDNNDHKKFKILHSLSVILTMIVLFSNLGWCFCI
tara:strand:+ start:304 stop:705 length:402 start_codon:yes stop_codon:yes gene_type:complete